MKLQKERCGQPAVAMADPMSEGWVSFAGRVASSMDSLRTDLWAFATVKPSPSADRLILSNERLWIASRALSWSIFGFVVWHLGLCRAGFDILGNPLGADFLSYYSASSLALKGMPSLAYNTDALGTVQDQLFAPEIAFAHFFYPPTYLLVIWPLALLPYFWSLALFQAVTASLYWWVVRQFSDKGVEHALVFAFPAAVLNLGFGQNGFLTTALLGAGLLCLKLRPVLAGIFLGCLVIKPHLGILIPFALIAARSWTAFASATVTVGVLTALTTLVFGLDVWTAFGGSIHLATDALEDNLIGYEKIVSPFAAICLLGGSSAAAYAFQAVVAAAVIVAVMWAFARRIEGASLALLATGVPLCTPYLLCYDLVLLALPLSWLYVEGRRTGFRPGEVLVGTCAFVVPLFSRIIGMFAGFPVASIIIAALFLVILRRALEQPTVSVETHASP